VINPVVNGFVITTDDSLMERLFYALNLVLLKSSTKSETANL
jgi:hypothetical protein